MKRDTKSTYESYELSKYTTPESVEELDKKDDETLAKMAIELAGPGLEEDIRRMNRKALMDTIILLG